MQHAKDLLLLNIKQTLDGFNESLKIIKESERNIKIHTEMNDKRSHLVKGMEDAVKKLNECEADNRPMMVNTCDGGPTIKKMPTPEERREYVETHAGIILLDEQLVRFRKMRQEQIPTSQHVFYQKKIDQLSDAKALLSKLLYENMP